MSLEKGIDKLVQEFIAAGRPSSRKQSIDDRRSGYVASTALAGETETRVQVETLVLEDMTFRVFSPFNAPEMLPSALYYHAVVLSAVGLKPMIISFANWRFTVTVGSLRFSTNSHPSIRSPLRMTMQRERQILSGKMQNSWSRPSAS